MASLSSVIRWRVIILLELRRWPHRGHLVIGLTMVILVIILVAERTLGNMQTRGKNISPASNRGLSFRLIQNSCSDKNTGDLWVSLILV